MQYVLIIEFAPGSDWTAQANNVLNYFRAAGARGTAMGPNVWMVDAQPDIGARDVANDVASHAGLTPGFHIFASEVTGNSFRG